MTEARGSLQAKIKRKASRKLLRVWRMLSVFLGCEWRLAGKNFDNPKFKNLNELLEHHFTTHSEPNHICRKTLTEAISRLAGKPAHIVETGSSAWGTNSSRLFDSYVWSFGGSFESVDIRVDPSLELHENCSPRSVFYCDDSVNFLKTWANRNSGKKIDLLYLDSWDLDIESPLPCAQHGLNEFLAVLPNLQSGSILLIDDTPASDEQLKIVLPSGVSTFQKSFKKYGFLPGKGGLVKPLLNYMKHGVEVLHEYQLLWQF